MKKVHIKSAVPIYIAAAVWLITGLIFPGMLLKLPTLILVAIISAGAGFVSRVFFPGRTVEVREKISTGDAVLDAEIEKGRVRLENLRNADIAIDHPGISAELERMIAAGEQIFGELGRDKGKYSLVRRFMSYYLPTSEKLIEQYQVLMQAKVKGDNVLVTMKRIEDNLGMIAAAFEKCLDKLYADQELDIDAEIEVMHTMIKSDGLTDEYAGKNAGVREGISLTLGGK